MSKLVSKNGYKRTHDFAPYTKANGQDVAEEFDAIQEHLEKVPALKDDGTGFAETFSIIDPTEDNHPATYGQLKNAENSVEQNKDLVIQKAEEVSQNAQQVALDTEATQQAKNLAVSAAQTATNKAEVATEKADIATEKADSITKSAKLAEQAKKSTLTSESNARKWAVNPEDNAVSNGEFSAYHHAIKARKSKESAEHFSSLAASASSSASSSEQVATNKANEVISSLNQISELKTSVDQKALIAQESAASASLSAQSAANTLSQVSQIKQHIENDRNEVVRDKKEVLDAKQQTLNSAQVVSQSVQNVVSTIEQARLNFIENGIKGDKGDNGENGATFSPTVSQTGVLSWTNDKGLPNPPNVIIKGPKGDKGDAGPVNISSSTDSESETTAASSKAVKTVKALVISVRNALNNYIPNSKKSNADNSTSSDTVATSYAVKKVRDIATTRATDVTAGQTVLSHKINGTDKTKAATEFALGELKKELDGKGVPIGSVVAFPKGITPQGYILGNGGHFSRHTYPDLYQALGVEILPNLNRSDVGMTAYFATDSIPEGWIAFDSIKNTVTQQKYPELYTYLVEKYGSISNVPLAEDRFIRNAGNGLSVGLTQGDAIRNITGYFEFRTYNTSEIVLTDGVFNVENGKRSSYTGNTNISSNHPKFKFDASRQVPTADENRPRSIVLKLCIKAKDKFNDVVFWIKAFGEITNAGTLDAGTLAQNIQQLSADKADKNHTHSYIDITDFKNGVANSYQHIFQENGWRKSPDGFIEQWGKALLNAGSGSGTDNPINFPIAFPNRVLNVVMSYAVMTDKRISQDPVLTTLTNTSMTIRQQSDRNVTVFWRAIGK